MESLVCVGIRVLIGESEGESVQRLGLSRQRAFTVHASDDLVYGTPSAASLVGVAVRHPQLRSLGEVEPGRCDAHYLKGLLRKPERRAHYIRTASEAVLPEAMPDHRYSRRRPVVLVMAEVATGGRGESEDLQHAPRYPCGVDPLRLPAFG